MRLKYYILYLFIILNLLPFFTGCSPYIHSVRSGRSELNTDQLATLIKSDYPFTYHKSIDWEVFSDSLSGYLKKSGPDEDDYLKIRELVYNIPDARIGVASKNDKSIMARETSGYLGFDIAFAPPDQYFVSRIDSQSEAWSKGIRKGNSIIGWNQTLISEKVNSFPLRWGYHPGSPDMKRIMACHYLTKGNPDSSVEVFFINNTENSKGVRIRFKKQDTAESPDYIGNFDLFGEEKAKNRNIDFRMLDDSLGYLRIDRFTPSGISYFRKNAAPAFSKLKGLIIDLRSNQGGYDPIAVSMANFFLTQSRLYEESFIQEGDERHTIGKLEAIPVDEAFTGNIIVLAGPMTMGVGEGFANIIQKEDHVKFLGAWNTAGSFSLPGGMIKLGNGIRLYYPIGGSMDENHNIIIEYGKQNKGLKPDIFIEPTKELILRMADGEDILLMEAFAHLTINSLIP